jgi:RNA polymerase sigma-70 factor (ECF subfamily)
LEGRPQVESEIVERARNGDVAAFEELVRVHQEVAFRTAWVVSGRANDAEDATQEGFVKAFAAMSRFRAGAPFRPWLLTIVANEARNRRRSAGRREALALRLSDEGRPGDAAPSPESAVLASERRAALLAAIERLEDRDREIIALRYLLDLSEAETAAVLNVPIGTVKSRLSRALGRLRMLLTTNGAQS